MRVLLDENFPLALLRRLRDKGHYAEHIILLGLRGSRIAAFSSVLTQVSCLRIDLGGDIRQGF
jgi:Domain of unknown function (DUF5615)